MELSKRLRRHLINNLRLLYNEGDREYTVLIAGIPGSARLAEDPDEEWDEQHPPQELAHAD